jgi:glycosyltransferase involved in cell wall biosynthesis
MTAKEDTGVQAPEQRVVAIIPAHNEERFIGSVVLRARTHADVVLVVDDGSTDATAQIAEAAAFLIISPLLSRSLDKWCA